MCARAVSTTSGGEYCAFRRRTPLVRELVIGSLTTTPWTGSFNWTTAANSKNAENVHILRGARALAARNAAYFLDRERVSEPYRNGR